MVNSIVLLIAIASMVSANISRECKWFKNWISLCLCLKYFIWVQCDSHE